MLDKLPPRERQIVELLYARGKATPAEVREGLPNPPSESAVRAMLTRLDTKGFVRRTRSEEGIVYSPRVPEAKVKQSVLRKVAETYFNGSFATAASALLGMSERVEDEVLDELERQIRQAREGETK